MSESSKIRESRKAVQKARQERRLAAALRENLKRRKLQAKARVAADTAVPNAPQPSAGPHDSAGFAEDKQNQ